MSIWLSSDPLSDMYPSTSPYMYVLGKPTALIDPNGMNAWIPPTEAGGDWTAEAGDGAWDLYTHPENTASWNDVKGAVSDMNADRGANEFMVHPGDKVSFSGSGGSSDGSSSSTVSSPSNTRNAPTINGQTGPWSQEAIDGHLDLLNDFLAYADGTNQATGYAVSFVGMAITESKLLQQFSSGTFYVGIAISAGRTDWTSKQSRIEFEIGTGIAAVAYKVPWALPFSAAWSAIMINKEYAKSLPERAATGYKMSNQQIMNHPYFRNK
ncbi:MAG: hypothetical protein DRI74_06910 [Bacteroidetes bacterium]|nr:MAG: hypothetical protein DRI74_06910 [Bacteroidota bacterium]